MKNKRYFVSFSFIGKFDNTLFANAVIESNGINFNLTEEIQKQNPEYKNLIILYFKELKPGEFENVK